MIGRLVMLTLMGLILNACTCGHFMHTAPQNNLSYCHMYAAVIDPETSPAMQQLSFKNQDSQLPDTRNIKTVYLDSYPLKPYTSYYAKQAYIHPLPSISKWMMVGVEGYQHPLPAAWLYWLGYGKPSIYTQGYSQPTQHILEAINFLILVRAQNEYEANNHLIQALDQAGFNNSESNHHSGGYSAIFNGRLISQLYMINDSEYLPLTFSKGHYETGNDHFRALGPYQVNRQYYLYAASVSQESPYFNQLNCGHMYVSFIKARNELAKGLIKEHIPIFTVKLHNTIKQPTMRSPANQIFYTGDFQQEKNNDLTFIAVINQKQNNNGSN